MSQGSGYKKVEHDRRRGPKPRKHFNAEGGVTCKTCFDLRNKNQELRNEITLLRSQLETARNVPNKIPIGAHTPSSRIDFKANTKEESHLKRGGATVGHKGSGRKSSTREDADEVVDLPMPESCETCDLALKLKDNRERTIIEAVPVIAKKVVYNCPRGQCPVCKKIYPATPPVLRRCLYGNSLISQAAVLHYVHGITLGKVIGIFGSNVTSGALIDCFHRLGKIADGARPFLIKEYRDSTARHADETGWRTDGYSGYAWLFCTSMISIFEFRDTRSSRVAREILGDEKLSGVLNVDRYGGYNKMPVHLQYCYAHLLREVEKLEKEFPGHKEIAHFVSAFSVQLSQAMKLRNRDISDTQFYVAARKLKDEMELVLCGDWKHFGIQKIQRIFHEKRSRLYHWVKDREVHADNNRAERELRPTVIARKVSFGSQSEAGARTRSSVMSLLHTVKKRLKNRSLEEWLTDAPNQISKDPNINIATLIPH
jgi:transposase